MMTRGKERARKSTRGGWSSSSSCAWLCSFGQKLKTKGRRSVLAQKPVFRASNPKHFFFRVRYVALASFGDEKISTQDIAILSSSARAPGSFIFTHEDKNTETKDRSKEDPRITRTDTHTQRERERSATNVILKSV